MNTMQSSSDSPLRPGDKGMKGRVLVLGVGNEYRSDDGLGICVVRELRRRVADGVDFLEHSGEGTALMAAWKHVPHVIVIDAVVSGKPAGTIHRFDPYLEDVPPVFFRSSSHEFGVYQAIELSRQLGELPPALVICGIEGESFDHGVGLSGSVVRSVPDLIRLVEDDLRRLMPRMSIESQPGLLPDLPEEP